MTDKWFTRFWQFFAVVFILLIGSVPGFIGGAIWKDDAVFIGGACPTIKSYFSPKGSTDTAIIDLINRSKKTLYVAIYSLTNADILTAIKMAEKRGVDVRVIQDKSQAGGRSALKYPGAKIVNGSAGGIMHNKFIISDTDCLESGSYNFSAGAELRNDENALVICDDFDLIAKYKKQFNKLW